MTPRAAAPSPERKAAAGAPADRGFDIAVIIIAGPPNCPYRPLLGRGLPAFAAVFAASLWGFGCGFAAVLGCFVPWL